jgi:hypothetical protein
MNETDETLMELYGITRKAKLTYYYKQHAYENLGDALRYAEIDTKRNLQPNTDDKGSLKDN